MNRYRQRSCSSNFKIFFWSRHFVFCSLRVTTLECFVLLIITLEELQGYNIPLEKNTFKTNQTAYKLKQRDCFHISIFKSHQNKIILLENLKSWFEGTNGRPAVDNMTIIITIIHFIYS